MAKEEEKYGLTAETPPMAEKMYKEWQAGTKRREEKQAEFAAQINPGAEKTFSVKGSPFSKDGCRGG